MQDVCYSWWCLSALSILGRMHWIDGAALSRFILYCQARGCRSASDWGANPCWTDCVFLSSIILVC